MKGFKVSVLTRKEVKGKEKMVEVGVEEEEVVQVDEESDVVEVDEEEMRKTLLESKGRRNG